MGQVSGGPVDVTLNPQAVKAGIKGLENDVGLNHCFLNVVIQSLWQVAAFRERLISLDYTHVHKNNPCIFCALRTIFTSFEFAESSIIPPDALRNAMAEIYRDQNRFQLKTTADAEEVLEEILSILHYDQVGLGFASRFKDLACSPPCISHSVFSAQICDILFCQRCNAQGDPAPRQGMLYRVYVADLLRCMGKTKEPFSQLLFKEYRQQVFSCPRPNEQNSQAACGGASRIHRYLLSAPLVFTMVLAWSPIPQRETIEAVFACLDHTIHLHKFMQTSVTHAFRLAGMICYYGAHYISFFNTKLLSRREGEWLRFDDKKVTKAGSWDQLVDRCVRGKFQPTIVFFESTLPQDKASVSLAKSMQPDHPPLILHALNASPAPTASGDVSGSAPSSSLSSSISLASLAALSASEAHPSQKALISLPSTSSSASSLSSSSAAASFGTGNHSGSSVPFAPMRLQSVGLHTTETNAQKVSPTLPGYHEALDLAAVPSHATNFVPPYQAGVIFH